MRKTILLIDDDPGVLQVVTRHVQKGGWQPFTAATGEEGLQLYAAHAPDVVLLDRNLPTISGAVVLDVLVARGASVVMLTGVAEVDVAVEAMQAGADGFLTKPIEFTVLDAAIQRAASSTEVRRVQGDADRARGQAGAFGASPRMQELERHVDLLAATNTTALLLGASGTGKTFIAEGIHRQLIAQAIAQQQITRGQLTLHADRGSSMRSKPVAFLLADLGVTKTHSRPYTSSDNPYSEAHFKTMKYRPGFPDRFGSIEVARTFCRSFFDWYSNTHRHSGIGLMTPAAVHYGRAGVLHAERARVLATAFAANPERFVRGVPVPPALPTAAWINPPSTVEVAR